MNKEERASIIRSMIALVIICAALLPIMFYLYPRSAIGNPLCKEMSAQGYYETEWDTAGHESCKISYDSKWNPFETNSSCMEKRLEWDSKNLSSYGFHCVWGGPGYWAFVGAMAIPFILLGLIGSVIGMIYTMLYTKPKDLNTQESMKY